MREYDLSEVRDALRFLDADDRDTWVRAALMLKATFGADGFDVWDDWSQSSGKYHARTALQVWKSGKAGRLTVGSLIKEARAAGWQPGEQHELSAEQVAERERRKVARAALLASEAEEAEQYRSVVADHCAELWERLAPTGMSRYLGTKKVGAHGVRFGREPVLSVIHKNEIRAELITDSPAVAAFLAAANEIPYELRPYSFRHIKRGCIAVPLRDEAFRLWQLQLIWPTGKKSFFYNGRKSGCFHLLGKVSPRTPLAIAEGYATAASIHEATGWPVAVALDAGNLLSVARALRAQFPEVEIVVAADNDEGTAGNPGATFGAEAAAAVGGRLALPVFTMESAA